MNSLTIRLPAPYTESIILESGMTMKKVPLADYQAMEAQSAEWRVKAAALDKELQAARDDAKHLREQLDKQQAETASLTRELDELRSLNDTLRLQAEQLRQEAEEARQAKSAYAPYLPAISKIYGMACESAGNIVRMAGEETDAVALRLSSQAAASREETARVLQNLEAARAQLGSVLPALQQTLQQALEQTDLFLRQAESIPQSFEDVERWRQALLARFEEENASFHERSRSVAEPNAPARPAEPLFSAPVPSPRPVPIAPPPACAPAPAPIPQPAVPAPAPVPLPESPPLSVQRPNIKKTLDKYAI